MSTVIKAASLSKKYMLDHQSTRETTLRSALTNGARKIGRRVLHPFGNRLSEGGREEFWALRDVAFEINQGDRMGIIGRNGAGKSTLLKILSRITEPTSGRVSIKGRIASLLEVGTGFHPELTGRENIFLNGAILGMTKEEITRKFDEIVEFAEIEQFLDTPVKRYSSGMYVRLAFAVAAHLEPEILVVDEVLAVGDVQFQKKCLGKMSDIGAEGRTVLFVSHNLAAIQHLCSKALMLDKGSLVIQGAVNGVIENYLEKFSERQLTATSDLQSLPRQRKMEVTFIEGYINGNLLVGHHAFRIHERLHFELVIRLQKPMRGSTLGIHFEDKSGVRVYVVNTRWKLKGIDFETGSYRITCIIDKVPLVSGTYYLSIGFSSTGRQVDWLDKVTAITFEQADIYGTGELPWSDQGYFLADADWNIAQVNEVKA